MKKAIYPGSFDPITNGHLDVLKRSLKVFDEVVILVADNSEKNARFTTEEKIQMIKEATQDLKGVSVDSTKMLTVQYAKLHGANCLIRGLRAVTDFDYEFKLMAANEYIDPTIDEVFFLSHGDTSFISSSTVNEMYNAGVDVSNLVPPSVIKMYKNKKK